MGAQCEWGGGSESEAGRWGDGRISEQNGGSSRIQHDPPQITSFRSGENINQRNKNNESDNNYCIGCVSACIYGCVRVCRAREKYIITQWKSIFGMALLNTQVGEQKRE